MSKLGVTLREQGDPVRAHKLHEETLAVRRRMLGPAHPNTSSSTWNLFRTLQDLGERDAARAIFERDLLWLLRRDPATLDADQRKIRDLIVESPAPSAGQ